MVRNTGMYSVVICFIQFRGSRSLERVYMELLQGTARLESAEDICDSPDLGLLVRCNKQEYANWMYREYGVQWIYAWEISLSRQNQDWIVTLVEIVNPLLRIYTQHPWIHLHQKKPSIYTVSYVRSSYNYRRIGTSPYFVCTDPRVLRCHDPSTHCGAQKEGLFCRAAWLRRLSLFPPFYSWVSQ